MIDPRIPGDVGTMVVAASQASEENIALMVNLGSGLIMCPADPLVLERLDIPLILEEDPWSTHKPLPYAMTVVSLSFHLNFNSNCRFITEF